MPVIPWLAVANGRLLEANVIGRPVYNLPRCTLTNPTPGKADVIDAEVDLFWKRRRSVEGAAVGDLPLPIVSLDDVIAA